MPRLFLPLILLSIAGAAMLIVPAYNQHTPANERAPAAAVAPQADLMMLGDGTTMVARSGSLSRAIADWIAQADTGPRHFAFGEDAFVPGTARLSPRGLGRAADLGRLLRATPDMKLVMPREQENSLHHARAKALAAFVQDRGILANQIIFENAATPKASTRPRQSDALSFVLRRGKMEES